MKKEQLHHIEEEFADLAWQNMSTLLDKEMPVKKKKRRSVFWFWSIALSALFVLGWTYWQSTNVPVVNAFPITKNQSSIIAKNTPPNTDKSTIKIIESKNEKIVKQESIKYPTSTKRSNKSPDNTPVISTIKRLTLTSSSAEVIAFPSADASSLRHEKRHIINQVKESNSLAKSEKDLLILKKENFTNQLSIIPTDFKKLTNFEKVPTLSFITFPISQNSLEETIPILKNRLKGKWKYGIYAGILAPKIKSFEAGLHVRYQLNPRWSFHTGLGYSKRKWNYGQAIETLSTEEMDPSSPLPDENMDNTGATGTSAGTGTAGGLDPIGTINLDLLENLIYTDFHYFDLPVFVQYRVSPRWSLSLGGQISRLYGYHYEQEDRTYFSNGFSNNNADLRNSTFAINETPLNKWNYSAIGGTSFALLPKLELYTNYQFGLNPRFKLNSDNSKWMQGSIGVRVYFR